MDKIQKKRIPLKKISEIADIQNGYAFRSENYVANGIRVIRIANVQDGFIVDDAPCFYPLDTEEDIDKYQLFEGDLLISLTGNVGRIGILPASMLPAALNQRVCCLRIDQSVVSRKYLFYYLRRHQFIRDCVKASKGVAQLNLSTKWLADYEIPLPDLGEQERIVARIEELFSELDSGVETLKTIKAQLKVYRQAVLKGIFSSDYNYAPLSEISDSRLGKMLDIKKNIGTPRHYLRNINVRWFCFDTSDLLEMRIEDDEADKYSVKKNDLVICEGGEPGRCAVWESNEQIFYQKALHRVRFKEKANSKFYMYYLWFAAQTGLLSPFFTGTGIKHLTGQSLAKVMVPIVGLDKQNELVSEIESHLSVCDEIEQTVGTALQQAEALRQSILKKAFEGRLV